MRGGGIGIFDICSLSYLLGFLDLLVFDLLVLSVVVVGGVCGEGGPAVGWRSRVHGRGSAGCCLFFYSISFHEWICAFCWGFQPLGRWVVGGNTMLNTSFDFVRLKRGCKWCDIFS